MWEIIYKDKDFIDKIKVSWKYLTELLYLIYKKTQVWVSWIELEDIAKEYISKYNLKWAFKWYMNYPTNICFSVNECVVHGVPSNYIIKEWDVVKIDIWINYKQAISDAAFSKVIWWRKYNEIWYQLVKSTKQALDDGIWTLKIWENFYNLWKTIFNTMRKKWFSIIKNLTWHGVWVKVHEMPYIYNYPNKELKKIILKNWMVFAIEPITAEKSSNFIEKSPQNWELLCEKQDIWAQWEYTIAVSDNKIEVVAWIQENLFDKEQ